MNAAIIVAAGSGTRFGAERPKQFLEIGGKPVLIHTLEKFEACAAIDEITVVLAENEIAGFRGELEKHDLKKISKIVAGGATRAESVRNAVNALDTEKVKTVAVHDGARPLVEPDEIAATIEKAAESGAACLVGKVNDTIKLISGERILETIDRESLRRALTPQTFRLEILKKSFADGNFDRKATDECFLVEKLGVSIVFTEGSAKNIKITTREDFALAEMLLNS